MRCQSTLLQRVSCQGSRIQDTALSTSAESNSIIKKITSRLHSRKPLRRNFSGTEFERPNPVKKTLHSDSEGMHLQSPTPIPNSVLAVERGRLDSITNDVYRELQRRREFPVLPCNFDPMQVLHATEGTFVGIYS